MQMNRTLTATNIGNGILPFERISVVMAKQVFQFAGQYRLNARAIQIDLALSDALLSDPDAWIDFSVYEKLWTRLIREVGGTRVGYDFGRFMAATSWASNLSLMALHCQNARQMLNILVDYDYLVRSHNPFCIVERSGLIALRVNMLPRTQEFVRHFCDAVFAGVNSLLNLTASESLDPCFIRVPYASDNNLVLASICGDVRTSQEICEIAYRTTDLEGPNPMANPLLLQLLETHAESRRKTPNRNDYWSLRVSAAMHRSLLNRRPTLATIAKQLAMSKRSLQQKLKNEGVTFKDLLEDVLMRKACGFLESSTYTIGQIAQLVGYSEQSSFNHAFRQCTGHTPREFRHMRRASDC